MKLSITSPKYGLRQLVGRYRYLVCDLWGVLHDGGAAFEPAVGALLQARRAGCRVVALSNSPKPAATVRAQLAEKGIGSAALDAVITSGELTRTYLERRCAGRRFFHLGPAEDHMTIDGLPLTRVEDIDHADLIVATGLIFDAPEAHDRLLAPAVRRGIDFLCANPDRLVRLGAARTPCAGVLADRYAAMGGHVLWMGKPEPRAYRACRDRLAEIVGHELSDNRLLAIGDGLATDIAGGVRAGLATLLIEDGLHREALAAQGFEAVCERYGVIPTYRMPQLVW